jgi:hypothetical protein
MKRTPVAMILVAVLALALPQPLAAQSPLAVKYCQDMATAYRSAIRAGKPPVAGASQAGANCQTNPDDSVPVLEGALKQLGIDLPPR